MASDKAEEVAGMSTKCNKSDFKEYGLCPMITESDGSILSRSLIFLLECKTDSINISLKRGIVTILGFQARCSLLQAHDSAIVVWNQPGDT